MREKKTKEIPINNERMFHSSFLLIVKEFAKKDSKISHRQIAFSRLTQPTNIVYGRFVCAFGCLLMTQ